METAECDVKQIKPTVETIIWIKLPLTRMKLQSDNMKQLTRSMFHKNFCQICKLNEEDWTKYNTIYLTTIYQLMWSIQSNILTMSIRLIHTIETINLIKKCNQYNQYFDNNWYDWHTKLIQIINTITVDTTWDEKMQIIFYVQRPN